MHICECALSEWHDMTGNGQDLLLLLSISLGESGLPTCLVDAEPSVLTYTVGFFDLHGTPYAPV